MLKIIHHRKIWFTFSSIIIIASIVCLSIFRLNLGIDFTGGTLSEIEFKDKRPALSEIQKVLESLELENISVQPTNEQAVLIRMKSIDEPKHQEMLNALNEEFKQKENLAIEEKRFESIGPTIGQELKKKAIIAILLVLICIILYIAWAFRKVSGEVPSWKFGICAVLALFHDILIVLGIFSLLGFLLKIEINSLFVIALLTVLGYSVNDSIVVFDRIRYNVLKSLSSSFEKTVEASVNQTMVRSINTSVTTLLVLFALYLFGGKTLEWFVLALIIGIIAGTYSSIFVASPLLVVWAKKKT